MGPWDSGLTRMRRSNGSSLPRYGRDLVPGECRDAYLARFGKRGTYDLNASGVVGGVKVYKRVLIRRKDVS